MLFDPGSTYSYMSVYFSLGFDFLYDIIFMTIHVSTPVGDPLVVDQVYRSYLVTLASYETWVDINRFDMVE